MDNIKLGSDIVFSLGGIPFTNSVLTAFFCSFLLICVGLWIRIGAGIIPTRRQVAMESFITYLHSGVVESFGSIRRGNFMFYIFCTIFLFIVIANQISLLPVINSIVVDLKNGADPITLLRTPTADLSLPLALAAVLMLGGHIWAFITHPFRYIGNYIRVKEIFKIRKLGDIPMAGIEIFLGLMDIIGEVAKIVSLSARLFGNLFAGEVMYIVLTGLVAFIAPMPIIAMGILSGFVQAFVFTTLAYQFMGGTVTSVDNS